MVGCTAGEAPGRALPSEPAAQAPSGPKRIAVGIVGDPHTLNYRIAQAEAAATPGVEAVEEMVHAGLANTGDLGLRALLAEAVPSLESGQWKVFPDGRMETSWTIRANARWQDGTPFTTQDLLFTAMVSQDRSNPLFYDVAYESVDSVDAVDERTLVVRWNRPFIDADALFTRARELAPIMPAHLLQAAYAEDKANFSKQPYWSEGFIGMGPYRLKTWLRGSHLVLEASDSYVLGRPRLDEITVKFIPDPDALVARILADDVDATVGRGISVEQALEIRERWRQGTAHIPLKSWQVIFPQFVNPRPAAVADLRFRRALLHAMGRQELAANLQAGITPVAHGFLSPEHPLYRQTESMIVRYDYDPRRAAQLFEEVGYTRGADGIIRDAAGQRLAFEWWTNGGDDFREKLQLAIADHWRRAGMEIEIVLVPQQRLGDREYRAQFPAVQLQRRDNELGEWKMFYSYKTPLPQNNFVGTNIPRYRSPEFDALMDRYDATIPIGERIQVLGQLIHHISDQLPFMGILYSTEAVIVGNRLTGVDPKKYFKSSHAWNVEQWNVR